MAVALNVANTKEVLVFANDEHLFQSIGDLINMYVGYNAELCTLTVGGRHVALDDRASAVIRYCTNKGEGLHLEPRSNLDDETTVSFIFKRRMY